MGVEVFIHLSNRVRLSSALITAGEGVQWSLSSSLGVQLCSFLGELWRCPYSILIAGIWTSLAEKVADMAEKLAQPFTQS